MRLVWGLRWKDDLTPQVGVDQVPLLSTSSRRSSRLAVTWEVSHSTLHRLLSLSFSTGQIVPISPTMIAGMFK